MEWCWTLECVSCEYVHYSVNMYVTLVTLLRPMWLVWKKTLSSQHFLHHLGIIVSGTVSGQVLNSDHVDMQVITGTVCSLYPVHWWSLNSDRSNWWKTHALKKHLLSLASVCITLCYRMYVCAGYFSVHTATRYCYVFRWPAWWKTSASASWRLPGWLEDLQRSLPLEGGIVKKRRIGLWNGHPNFWK